MNYDNKKTAGLLIFVGVVQFVLAVVICEAIYSGYSVGHQYVSDLGNWILAGNSAAIFDISVILMNTFTIAGAYFVQRIFKNMIFTALLVMIGLAGIGAGVVAEDISLPLHTVFALVIFLSGAASALMSIKFEKSPLSYVSFIFGAVILLAIVLFGLGVYVNSGFYLGLGSGGMERFIIYPSLLWLLSFGVYLIGDSSNTTITSKA